MLFEVVEHIVDIAYYYCYLNTYYKDIDCKDFDNFSTTFLAYAKNNEGYKNLLKLSTYKNTNEIVDYLSLFKQYNKGLKYVMVLDRSIIERLYTAKSYNELDTRIKELNQLEDFYVGYS